MICSVSAGTGGITAGCCASCTTSAVSCFSSSEDDVIPLKMSSFTGNSFETISVLIGLVNTTFAVIFSMVFSARAVVSCNLPEALTGNGVGDEDVFSKVPLELYTFITPFTRSCTVIGSWVA